MIRLLGAVLLSVSALFIGIALRRRALNRVKALAEAAEKVRKIRQNIALFNTPAGDLIGDAERKTQARLYMELAEDAPILREFYEKLGRDCREETLRMCDFTASVLEEKQKAAEKVYQAHARMYTAIPLLISFSIIVLIL